VRRGDLVPDCASCAAICCIAPAFDASADFAFDKPAGLACRHLLSDRRCSIHEELIERGFRGCAAYDCYGAGQRATRAFPGADDAERRHEAFRALRAVHELLWLLTEAAKLCPPSQAALAARLSAEIHTLDAIASGPPPSFFEIDLGPRRLAAQELLRLTGHALGGRERAATTVGQRD
jgi:hypothetical protein